MGRPRTRPSWRTACRPSGTPSLNAARQASKQCQRLEENATRVRSRAQSFTYGLDLAASGSLRKGSFRSCDRVSAARDPSRLGGGFYTEGRHIWSVRSGFCLTASR